MQRTLSNRTVAALVVGFSVIGTVILHSNPFGTGQIPWIGAVIVSLAGNSVLAYALTGWAAPYVASTGGRRGAEQADPRAVETAEDWIAATLMSVGVVALLAVSFTSRDLIITPTDHTQKNAELVKHTVELHAPRDYQSLLTAADTWKVNPQTLRTCVPSAKDHKQFWCVVVRGEGIKLRVISYGPGISNAAQFLKTHPNYKPE